MAACCQVEADHRIAVEVCLASNVQTRAVADHDLRESFYDVIMALNLLHLLEDPAAAVTAACRGLKPGGVFVTSTACIGDMSWYFRLIAPVGRFFRLIPLVRPRMCA